MAEETISALKKENKQLKNTILELQETIAELFAENASLKLFVGGNDK